MMDGWVPLFPMNRRINYFISSKKKVSSSIIPFLKCEMECKIITCWKQCNSSKCNRWKQCNRARPGQREHGNNVTLKLLAVTLFPFSLFRKETRASCLLSPVVSSLLVPKLSGLFSIDLPPRKKSKRSAQKGGFTRGRAGSPAWRTTGCSDSLLCPFPCPSVARTVSRTGARSLQLKSGWPEGVGEGGTRLEEDGPSVVCAHTEAPPPV